MKLGKDQEHVLLWIAERGGSVHAPKGDRVLRSLVKRGLLRQGPPVRGAVVSAADVRDFGKSPTWRPKDRTWTLYTLGAASDA